MLFLLGIVHVRWGFQQTHGAQASHQTTDHSTVKNGRGNESLGRTAEEKGHKAAETGNTKGPRGGQVKETTW